MLQPSSVCVLLVWSQLVHSSVFLDQPIAGQVLRSVSSSSRRRRANSIGEEMLPGDLERECYEESCSQEEAAEIFQNRERTLEFWYRYKNLNPCQNNPCLNGGVCSLDRGQFVCDCLPQYQGKTCETEVWVCSHRNGGCEQYCRDLLGGLGVQCSCADGFSLDPDGQRCSPAVSFPCGRQREELWYQGRSLLDEYVWDNVTMETDVNVTASWDHKLNLTETGNTTWTEGEHNDTSLSGGEREDLRIVGGNLERLGRSPWQVLIRRTDGYGFCGGTLVSDRWVISAAHCFEDSADHVTIGDYDKLRPDQGEQKIKIQQVFVHPHFHSYTFDSDIALLLLAQPVDRSATAVPACLPDQHLSTYLLKPSNRGAVSGWGLTRFMGRSSRFLRKVVLPVVSYNDCIASTEQVITDNMFCAGYLDVSVDACSGDSGGPFVVNYRGTWFLTGVVSWGEKCAAKGKYGVYTRLGNFLGWIRDTMHRQDAKKRQDPI